MCRPTAPTVTGHRGAQAPRFRVLLACPAATSSSRCRPSRPAPDRRPSCINWPRAIPTRRLNSWRAISRACPGLEAHPDVPIRHPLQSVSASTRASPWGRRRARCDVRLRDTACRFRRAVARKGAGCRRWFRWRDRGQLSQALGRRLGGCDTGRAQPPFRFMSDVQPRPRRLPPYRGPELRLSGTACPRRRPDARRGRRNRSGPPQGTTPGRSVGAV